MEWWRIWMATFRRRRPHQNSSPHTAVELNHTSRTARVLSISSTDAVEIHYLLGPNPAGRNLRVEGMRIGNAFGENISKSPLRPIISGDYDALVLTGAVDQNAGLIRKIRIMADYKNTPIVAITECTKKSTLRKLLKSGASTAFSNSNSIDMVYKYITEIVTSPGCKN